jgi:hypothetical protein
MKAPPLPQAIQEAVNALEAAATAREKAQQLGLSLGAPDGRLVEARFSLATLINAECARQFEAGIEAGKQAAS